MPQLACNCGCYGDHVRVSAYDRASQPNPAAASEAPGFAGLVARVEPAVMAVIVRLEERAKFSRAAGARHALDVGLVRTRGAQSHAGNSKTLLGNCWKSCRARSRYDHPLVKRQAAAPLDWTCQTHLIS
jgi:hypothetical protein